MEKQMVDADLEKNSGCCNVNYECNVCGKQLSRKQRLQSHLSTVHGINDENTGRYKKYVADPNYPIPKRTLIRMKKVKELKNTESACFSNDSPQLVSTVIQEAGTSTSDEYDQLLNHQYLDCGSSSDSSDSSNV
ncbi:uncharacterized protein LOC132740664 [Ruditapes philippinarum]|uniref:uncharacterized protein LOC132740664 n=1 Tax=Ruditapes philippinarum TaxID=129788 RepID=UPI00295BDFC5|nr:uncharacterized protein LOC132740664 [Ruditapes philippinarum]